MRVFEGATVTYDNGSWYIELDPSDETKVRETCGASRHVNLDYSASGALLGIEII